MPGAPPGPRLRRHGISWGVESHHVSRSRDGGCRSGSCRARSRRPGPVSHGFAGAARPARMASGGTPYQARVAPGERRRSRYSPTCTAREAPAALRPAGRAPPAHLRQHHIGQEEIDALVVVPAASSNAWRGTWLPRARCRQTSQGTAGSLSGWPGHPRRRGWFRSRPR